MAEYRRAFIPGGTYFFTLVTYNRRPFLTSEISRKALRLAWKSVQQKQPFKCDAICLLPNHLHCIWSLPKDDSNYPVRWAAIKALFTKYYLQHGGIEEDRNDSRIRKGEAALWQRRYWEHYIRDEKDYQKHFDYIHYNPVKHGLVKSVSQWKWSSFHKYYEKGFYTVGWGNIGIDFDIDYDDFGE